MPPGRFRQFPQFHRKAAEQGYTEAQYNLGVMYGSSQGVEQDYAEAVRWYRKSAVQGYAGAQYNLGVMYENGLGVAKDYIEAHKWWDLAAAAGITEADKYRSIVAERMTSAQIAEAQKLAQEWRPKKTE